MEKKTIQIELVPISKKFIASGGYRGRLTDQTVISYDDVIEEVIKNHYLSINARNLKTLVEDTLDTMIEGVLSDGKARRLGDYFVIQPEICGKFDSPDEQFDQTKHKLALTLRPLKNMRKKATNINIYNRNAGPKVVLASIRSLNAPTEGMVCFGEDMIIEGVNLWQSLFVDSVDVEYTAEGFVSRASIPGGACDVNETGTQMIVPWDKTVKEIIDHNPEAADPRTHKPISVKVTVESHGGVAKSRRQTHRIKAKVLS